MPRKKSAKSAPSTPKTEASAPKTKANGALNKAAYVRSLPTTLSAKEIVARAKREHGITLSEKHVYVIRSNQRKASKKASPGRKPGRPAKAAGKAVTHSAPKAASGHSQSHPQGAQAFIHMALDLGLARAEAILKSVRDRLTNLG